MEKTQDRLLRLIQNMSENTLKLDTSVTFTAGSNVGRIHWWRKDTMIECSSLDFNFQGTSVSLSSEDSFFEEAIADWFPRTAYIPLRVSAKIVDMIRRTLKENEVWLQQK